MLGGITVADEIYVVCGYTDMRSANGLCAIVQDKLHMNPQCTCICSVGKDVTESKIFCGKAMDFCFSNKWMEAQRRFRWLRNSEEVKSLTWQQFDRLMSGLEIEQPKHSRFLKT